MPLPVRIRPCSNYGKYTLGPPAKNPHARDSNANFAYNSNLNNTSDVNRKTCEILAKRIVSKDVALVARHNVAVADINESRSFTGSALNCGGISSTDTSFQGLMRSFYSGFVLDQAKSKNFNMRSTQIDGSRKKSGLLANHFYHLNQIQNDKRVEGKISKAMLGDSNTGRSGDDVCSFLHIEDWPLLYENALKQVLDSVGKLKKLNHFLR